MSEEKTKEQLLEEINLLRQQMMKSDKRKEKAEDLISGILAGIGIVQERVIQWTNRYLSEMTGYSAGELQGQNSRILYPNDEEYNRVGIVKYEQLERTGKGVIETRFKHKNGNIIDILLNSKYANNVDQSKGVIFTALDITKQKILEQQLKLYTDDWTQTFDAIPDMIILLDVNNKITRCNKAFADMFKLQENDIIGKKCCNLVHNIEIPIQLCPFELIK